eukprot:ANDGO_00231.mRNA.1 hypothetical protein
MRNEAQIRKVLTQWINAQRLIPPIRDIAFDFRHSSALFQFVAKYILDHFEDENAPDLIRIEELVMQFSLPPSLEVPNPKVSFAFALDVLSRRSDIDPKSLPIHRLFFDPSTSLHVTELVLQIFKSFASKYIRNVRKDDVFLFVNDYLKLHGEAIADVTPSQILRVLHVLKKEVDPEIWFLRDAADWSLSREFFVCQLMVVQEHLFFCVPESPANDTKGGDPAKRDQHTDMGANDAMLSDLADVYKTADEEAPEPDDFPLLDEQSAEQLAESIIHKSSSKSGFRPFGTSSEIGLRRASSISSTTVDLSQTHRRSAFVPQAFDGRSSSSYTPKDNIVMSHPIRHVQTPAERSLMRWRRDQLNNKNRYISSFSQNALSSVAPWKANPKRLQTASRISQPVSRSVDVQEIGKRVPDLEMRMMVSSLHSVRGHHENTGAQDEEMVGHESSKLFPSRSAFLSRSRPSSAVNASHSSSGVAAPSSASTSMSRHMPNKTIIWIFDYSSLCILYNIKHWVKHQIAAVIPDYGRVLTSDSTLFFHKGKHVLDSYGQKQPIPALFWTAIRKTGSCLTGVLRKTSDIEFHRLKQMHDRRSYHKWVLTSVPNFEGCMAWIVVDTRCITPSAGESGPQASSKELNDPIFFDPLSEDQMIPLQLVRQDFASFGADFLQVSDENSFIPCAGVSERTDPCTVSLAADRSGLFSEPREYLKRYGLRDD